MQSAYKEIVPGKELENINQLVVLLSKMDSLKGIDLRHILIFFRDKYM